MTGPRPVPPLGTGRRRYAWWMRWCTRASLAVLLVAFGAYVLEVHPPHVPIDDLPRLWSMSAGDYLRETGIGPGWGWAALAHRADLLNIVGIAMLASCSIPCLAAVIPVYLARREPVLALICALQVAVLVLAASGILDAGH